MHATNKIKEENNYEYSFGTPQSLLGCKRNNFNFFLLKIFSPS